MRIRFCLKQKHLKEQNGLGNLPPTHGWKENIDMELEVKRGIFMAHHNDK